MTTEIWTDWAGREIRRLRVDVDDLRRANAGRMIQELQQCLSDIALARKCGMGSRGSERLEKAEEAMKRLIAQGIEAALAGETTQIGSTEGKSPVPQGCAQQPGGSPSVRETE